MQTKHVKLTVEETVKYESEIIFERPDSMSDEELEKLISQVEEECKNDCAKSIAFLLKHKYGINVVHVNNGFPNAPSDSELEITSVIKGDFAQNLLLTVRNK